MKRVAEFLIVIRSLVIFLALAIALFWLINPSIPGVHGIWDTFLNVAGALVAMWLLMWIYKSGSKKNTDKAS